MKRKIIFGRSIQDILLASGPSFIILTLAGLVAYKFISPGPPKHLVIAVGNDEGGYQYFAKRYAEILKKSGVQLEARTTSGARENLTQLEDPKSGVDVAFVQDGLDPKEPSEHLMYLGSLYYEPLWVFYRGKESLSRFTQLRGKKVVVGERGGGTPALAWKLLKASGLDKTTTEILHTDYVGAIQSLRQGEADAAFFLATPYNPLIKELMADPSLRVMDVDQAEAISRRIPYLHHLVLPHGAIDLAKSLPSHDVNLIAPTATLIARDTLHPALIDLLLKAATQVHSRSGIFEKKNEFPIDRDSDFPISDEARHFYKSGTPFWQRYLPFWLAALVDRFILVVLPLLALLLPLIKAIPRVYQWRIRSRIYQRYGELKYLETQVENEPNRQRYSEHLKELDVIEARVNQMKLPLEYSEHIYGLRGHIDFVRSRLSRSFELQSN